MSYVYTSRPYRDEEKQSAIKELLHNTAPDRDFYLLLMGAVLLAVFGIFLDSIPVLIASMIVAPLAYPILGLGLGIVVRDWRIIVRSFGTLLLSSCIAIVVAAVVTFFFGGIRVDPVFISFESNLYVAIAIALIAGFIAAYGLMRPKVGGAMTGIGIAVSLMPPLVATGIGFADVNSFPPALTFLVFLLNVGGILLGSMFTFIFMGFHGVYRQMMHP